jgi:sialic acid synthase SpsE/spore coat polysaccharide biosynthesis protein SpsF (cytidylyltransferase family)
MREIVLGRFRITDDSEPYIIAEIGVNHEGSMETAKRLIELAKEGGAHAAKFQSYKAATLASKHSPAYWDLTKERTTSQFALFQKYDRFGPEQYIALAEHCWGVGIEFLSTPFDDAAIDFLEPLMPFYKIASADLTNEPFLRKIAAKGKPVILSTGASRLGEIDAAIATLHGAGCRDIALLHCILNYPTPDENAHLDMIPALRAAYPDYVVGYSDHTLPDPAMVSLTSAFLKGARIIEKHFTHDKSLPGNDHYHAMTAEDLAVFVRNAAKVRTLEGLKVKVPIPTEQISRRNARRSIVLARSARAGEPLTEADLVCKRPGSGVSPMELERVVGLRPVRDLDEDHILQWSDLEAADFGEKVVAVVQARMGSTRFPRKMLAKLGKHPLIEWVLSRVLKAQELDEVVLATSVDPANDALEQVAQRLGVKVIRGAEENVLSRFIQATRETNADVVVRVCADNPFIEPAEIDRLVRFYKSKRPEYAFNHIPRMSNHYADGLGAEVFPASLLDEMNRSAFRPAHREHVTGYLWEFPHAFDIATFEAPDDLAFETLRFDIDTAEDLSRLEPLAERLGMEADAADFIRAELARR